VLVFHIRRTIKLAVAVVAGLFLIAVVAGVVGVGAYLRGGGAETAIESIAALPLVNQNYDPDSEYLSDGLTESIISSLAQLPNLKVIPSSSALRYTKAKKALEVQRRSITIDNSLEPN
jgi:TolB-like protein